MTPPEAKSGEKRVALICDVGGAGHGVITVPLRTIDVTTSGHTDMSCTKCGGPMVLL